MPAPLTRARYRLERMRGNSHVRREWRQRRSLIRPNFRRVERIEYPNREGWKSGLAKSRNRKSRNMNLKERKSSCTFPALTCKSLIINGAGEGNRTLVIITNADSCGIPRIIPKKHRETQLARTEHNWLATEAHPGAVERAYQDAHA